MKREIRLKKLYFRSWHRGTREADNMIGGYFDKYGATWTNEQLDWFEELLEQEDVDIMAWAIGTLPVPEHFEGPQMDDFRKLDFIDFAK